MRRLALLLLVGCTSSDADRCPAPDVPAFSCAPLPAGSAGCVGSCHMLCGVNEPVATPMDGATFPVGCRETLTVCLPTFPDEPITCECESNGAGSGFWTGGC